MTQRSRPPFPRTLLWFWFVRVLPIWGGIALMIFLMQIAVCGIVHDNENVQTLLQFLDLLPSVIKSALGGQSLRVGNTAALIAIGYNHPFVLFLYMLFAVGIPTMLLTGEVQKGTMELILSRPATKNQVYLCAAALTVVGMFALVMVMFLGTVVAVNVYHFGEPIPLDLFFRIAIVGGLLASACGGVALLSAASFGRLYGAIGASVAFLVANYFVSIIADWWPRMRFLRPATLFHYLGDSRISYEWPLSDMCVLTSVLVLSAIAGGVIWHRRDLPL
jgi:ABC-2 type transport system permease protein